MLTARSARTIVTAGDPGANAASFARHLRAANLTPKTQRTYLDALAAFARFLTDAGIPTGGARSAASTSRRSSPTSWRAQDVVAAKGICRGGAGVMGHCTVIYTDIQHPIQPLPGV